MKDENLINKQINGDEECHNSNGYIEKFNILVEDVLAKKVTPYLCRSGCKFYEYDLIRCKQSCSYTESEIIPLIRCQMFEMDQFANEKEKFNLPFYMYYLGD